MPYFYMDDDGFFDEITDPAMRWTQDMARRAGMELGSIRMGTQTDEQPPMAQLLKLPPHGVIPRHAHGCYRVEVVVRGSLDVGNRRVLRPGDVMISEPNEFYGPNTAGPDGAVSVEMFSDGTAKTVFADAEMAWASDLATEGQAELRAQARLARGARALPSPSHRRVRGLNAR